MELQDKELPKVRDVENEQKTDLESEQRIQAEKITRIRKKKRIIHDLIVYVICLAIAFGVWVSVR